MSAQQQPTQRRSPRLAAKKQATASFADLPELALSAIHDILMRWSEDSEQFVECARAQDAAAFRSTCKAFNAAAMLPRTLKLKFGKPPSMQASQSLAATLCKPTAANTQLSLKLSRKSVSYDQAWVHRLAGLRVIKLQMPCLSINATLAAACTAVPGLESLTLYINSITEVGLPLSTGSWRSCSQLREVTLVVSTGDPPFHLRGSGSFPLLDLSGFPALELLRLLGPIVKDSRDFNLNEVPLMLPSAAAKVVVDPNMGRRTPTPWARERESCWRALEIPGKAIPSSDEYKEEDFASRRRRMCAFAQRVSEIACEMAEERNLEGALGMKRGIEDSFLHGGVLESMMAIAGIQGRSDLLDSRLDAVTMAEDEVEDLEELEKEYSGDEMCGYGGCCGCCGCCSSDDEMCEYGECCGCSGYH